MRNISWIRHFFLIGLTSALPALAAAFSVSSQHGQNALTQPASESTCRESDVSLICQVSADLTGVIQSLSVSGTMANVSKVTAEVKRLQNPSYVPNVESQEVAKDVQDELDRNLPILERDLARAPSAKVRQGLLSFLDRFTTCMNGLEWRLSEPDAAYKSRRLSCVQLLKSSRDEVIASFRG